MKQRCRRVGKQYHYLGYFFKKSDLVATFSDSENINKDVCLLVDIETTTKQCAEQCDLS